MASQRLKRRARSLARSQNAPAKAAIRSQIKGTRRETRRESGALSSEGRALQQGISAARKDFLRVPGLTGRDQRLALEELASRRVDAAGGIASQQSALRGDTRGTVADLRGQLVQQGVQQGSDFQAALSDLLSQRQANQHDIRTTKLGSRLDLKNALAEAAQQAGLSASSGTSSGGLTPLQKREAHQKRGDALSLARAAIQAAMAPGSKVTPPTTPQEWQSFTDALYNANQTRINFGDAAWAVKQLQRQSSPEALLRDFSPAPPITNLALLAAHALSRGR